MEPTEELTPHEAELVVNGTALMMERDTLAERVEQLQREREEMHRSHLRSESAWRKAGDQHAEQLRAAKDEAAHYRGMVHSMKKKLPTLLRAYIALERVFEDEELTDKGKERIAEAKQLLNLIAREDM